LLIRPTAADFDATFRTLWRVATLLHKVRLETQNQIGWVRFALGDTAIYLAPTDARAAQLKAAGKKIQSLRTSEFLN